MNEKLYGYIRNVGTGESFEVEPPPRPETVERPVAWTYELASYRDQQTGEYSRFKQYLSWSEPHVPEGSLRGLTPLFARPHAASPIRFEPVLSCPVCGRETDERGQLDCDCGASPASEPCPYCNGVFTGLPGNACENCMNTGLASPAAPDMVKSMHGEPISPTGNAVDVDLYSPAPPEGVEPLAARQWREAFERSCDDVATLRAQLAEAARVWGIYKDRNDKLEVEKSSLKSTLEEANKRRSKAEAALAEKEAEIEHMKRENIHLDAIHTAALAEKDKRIGRYSADLHNAENIIAARNTRIGELEEGLRPVVELWDYHEEPAKLDAYHVDLTWTSARTGVTVGDLRRARALLSAAEGEAKT